MAAAETLGQVASGEGAVEAGRAGGEEEMKAIYRNRLYILEDLAAVHAILTDVETGEVLVRPYGDPDLIIDPTDDEYFACENVKEEK